MARGHRIHEGLSQQQCTLLDTMSANLFTAGADAVAGSGPPSSDTSSEAHRAVVNPDSRVLLRAETAPVHSQPEAVPTAGTQTGSSC